MTGRVDIEKEGTQLQLKIVGHINENTDFPEVNLDDDDTEVTVNFGSCESINSLALRVYVDWVKTIAEKKPLIYTHCPPEIVDQINTIKGFLPDSARVGSVYAAYYCEQCDVMKNVLVTIDAELNEVQGANECEKCQGRMEFDDIEEEYFAFCSSA